MILRSETKSQIGQMGHKSQMTFIIMDGTYMTYVTYMTQFDAYRGTKH